MTTSMLFILAFGLAMDAFAVSVTNGMSYRLPVWKNALLSGLAFGAFQAAMPLIGYLAGSAFSSVIERFDHWIALALLSFIGGNMIGGAIKQIRSPEDCPSREFSVKALCIQATATSIDALAIGVGLGVMQTNILTAVGCIGLITFLCCFAGVYIGKAFGGLLKEKAELLGGVILIFIGIRIFVEHVF